MYSRNILTNEGINIVGLGNCTWIHPHEFHGWTITCTEEQLVILKLKYGDAIEIQ